MRLHYQRFIGHVVIVIHSQHQYECKIAVSPLLRHFRYSSLTLSQHVIEKTVRTEDIVSNPLGTATWVITAQNKALGGAAICCKMWCYFHIFTDYVSKSFTHYISSLACDCGIIIVDTLEIQQPCTNPLTHYKRQHWTVSTFSAAPRALHEWVITECEQNPQWGSFPMWNVALLPLFHRPCSSYCATSFRVVSQKIANYNGCAWLS